MGNLQTTIAPMAKAVIVKQDDGEIQITFTIPFSEIKKGQEETVAEMAKDIEVPGFRKGKAPLERVREKIPQATLIEHSLSHILPQLLADAIKENNLKIAIYPKFELRKAEENQDWEIVGRTCELPEVNLGSYKDLVAGEIRAASLKKDLTREEKEQAVIKALIENIKPVIPKILVEEEVNSRLANLLSRIEKLGLALETYLTQIGKTPDTLRAEYETQAKEAIALDLILSKIAEAENIAVADNEVDEAVKMAGAGEENTSLIRAILKKRKALEFLTNLK